ncbi:hypothetical protein CSE16_02815 [Solibacillus sp. R5-41]|uniref:S-layer homology domain-containing protein n=1 Tax=Solibacillus sp. R5-41 TaxID=2048654 RepID=UPI000C125A86|nr:S-layer homology domain-containing protein [Solibacillus sp. R5-41]ATP39041.1 hypothetical protein CSE16_02815 [Solibacillus sp. R5-41]
MSKINKSRKLFATTATAALVASAIVPVASASNFTDADKIAPWATDAVNFLSEQEVIGGNPDGSFNPRGNITRAEAAKMFTAALKLSEEGTEDFKDVSEKDWYYGPIVAVSNAGIVNGKGAGLFAPKANLTRAEAAKMIVEAYGLTGEADLSSFSDAKTVSGKWSEEYLSTAVANGVINGKDGKLAANDSITRQEFAVMFKRAMDSVEVDFAGELANAVSDLEKATKALNVEVKIETIAETKAAVATAKTAITTTQAALDAAVKAAAITTDDAAKVQVTITKATELVKVTEEKIAKVEEAAKELTVQSISAKNATQVEIKFSKAVDKDTLFKNGISGALATADTVTIKSLETNGPVSIIGGELSEDGKTLVLTTATVLEKRYDFTVKGLKSTDGKNLKEHKQMLTIEADKTAPVITGTEKVSANLVKVTFSEPVKTLGTVSFKLEDGTAVTGIQEKTAFVAGDSSVIYDLTKAQVNGKDLATGVNVTATFVGVQDQNHNLLTPNPASVTFAKGAKDGVAPTVSVVTQTGAKEFTVKFSEQLIANPTIKVGTTTLDTANVVQDTADKTKYVVKTTEVLDGATTISVDGYTDLSGETGAAFSKVYTFVKDVVAAKPTKSAVVQDATDGKQYLEITFDKNVAIDDTSKVTVKGTQVKDFVTVAVDKSAAVSYKSKTDKKVIRVALSTLLDNAASYNVGATYDLDVTFANVKSETGVAVDSTTADFKLVADGTAAAAGKVAVTSVTPGATNDQVTVTFDGNVDLATATTAANYTVDGAVVESATAASSKTNVITLKLKANSNTFTGIRNVTVKEVKKLDGTVAMDTQTVVSAPLNENILPTVTTAKLTAVNTIKVTFSENVTDGTAVDFVLNVGGEAVKTTVTTATTSTGNVLELTLGTAVTAADLAKGLSLSAATTVDIKDAVGNKLTVPTAITVAQ